MRALALTAVLLGTVSVPAIGLAQDVGTAGAVNPASTGTPPARATRVLQLGSRVVHRERINTSAGGNVQLVFLDKTTMSIGPNSDIVIDEFVYDPNAGTGRMAASMAKGVLRFVGGATSHSGGAEIKTPSATLGIRGGVATVEVRPCGPGIASADCGTKVVSHFGILSITSAVGTEIIRRPGFVVQIPGAGAAPTAPRRVTQAEVNQVNRQVSSKPGQSGGRERVSQAVIARADTVGPVLAQVGTAVISEQRQTVARQLSGSQVLGLSVAPLDATSPTQIQQIATNVFQQVNTQTQQVQAETFAPPPENGGTNPPPNTTPPSPQAFALGYNGSGVPFLPPVLPQGGNQYNSPVLGYADGGTNTDGARNTNRVLQAGLAINGSGSGQASSIYLLVGQTAAANGTNIFNGGISGTYLAASNQLPSRGSSGAVGSGSGVAVNGNNVLTALGFGSGSVDESTGQVTNGTATLVTNPGRIATNYPYAGGATQIATPNGLGSNRPVTTSVPNSYFGGMVGGIVSTVNNTTGAITAPTTVSGLFDLAFNSASSQFGTTLGINAASSGSDGLQSAFLDYGKAVDSFYSRPGAVDGRGTYVDYNNFGAIESLSSADKSFTSTVNGSAVTDNRGLFVSADAVNAKSFFPGVTFCDCEYTRWGFWSSETTRNNASGQSLTDILHLGTWVFGVPAEANQIPSTGTATYTGHAIATIQNGSSQYIAAGNFQNAVNFGTGSGAVTVSNLDSRSYAGNVTIGTTYNGISGTLASTSGPSASMSLNGLLYRGAIGPVGEMGGNLTISGQNYLGSGIFAASTRSITGAP